MRQISLTHDETRLHCSDRAPRDREEVHLSTTVESGYQGIRLKCPRCRANLDGLICLFCGFRMRVNRGIVHALPADRATYYAQFIKDYERIREAEGRGSKTDEFYLNLPFRDISGTNNKHWTIRACSFSYLVKRVLDDASLMKGKRILDLGAGNCWLSYRLFLAGFRPVAVDLLTNDYDGLGAAVHFQNQMPTLFPRFQAELRRLPFQDEQFDVAVFNASFHYSEDYEGSMREALRCVTKGGLVIVVDTPWYSSEQAGRAMLAERRAAFLRRYGTASDSISSLEYLTDDRLRTLEKQLSIRWSIHSPWYGFRWALRPLLARLSNRREPSRFRIYTVRKS